MHSLGKSYFICVLERLCVNKVHIMVFIVNVYLDKEIENMREFWFLGFTVHIIRYKLKISKYSTLVEASIKATS